MLRIGYLMQNGAADLSTLSGPQLHVKAVIHGLQRRGHSVRTVATQNKRLVWSDDLQTWAPASYKFSRSNWFRLIESPTRRLQSEINLPFLGLFDSIHYADAFSQALRGYDIFYERHGYLGYGGLIASRWLKIPLIIEINGNIIKEIDEIGIEMSDVQRKIGKSITYRTWSAASHLVVVSDTLKRQLIGTHHIPEEKVSVVLMELIWTPLPRWLITAG